jgi:hypothetical protein
MTVTTAWVIENPRSDYLKPLRQRQESLEIFLSDQLQVPQNAALESEVLIAADPKLLRAVFPIASRSRLLHSLSAGVDANLFPEPLASPVVMTDMRSVFKSSWRGS